MGIVREPRVGGTSNFVSRHQATTGEDIADREGFLHDIVNCRLCVLAIALQLLVITFCKDSINPVTNQNPDYNHSIKS
jgi:hypothetical protein